MEDIYLTDQIVIRNKKTYYIDEQEEIEIKNHNWHRYLRDIGWEKLDHPWIKKLNSLLDKPKNNSLFGCIDCGGEGNCLFHCLSFSRDNGTNFQDIRNQLSGSITREKFQEIISIYRILDETGDFEETWDPQNITFEEFKEKIVIGGNEYWGDSFLINLIRETLNINIFILYSNDFDKQYFHYPLLYTYDKDKETIVLIYENEAHFQLLGYFYQGVMIYKFTDETVPIQLRRLIILR